MWNLIYLLPAALAAGALWEVFSPVLASLARVLASLPLA